MAVDEDQAMRLRDAMGVFVNSWTEQNLPGGLPKGLILAVLLGHAGELIRSVDDQEMRVQLVCQGIKQLVQQSEAPVLVSVAHATDAATAALVHAKPAGRA